ncbi:hypothetical protein [Hymenobacter sp. IS2118]|uniref:hypothetical protein n=1 Tax=Hymenobacter sp. IS2118 TaxID=1505605 RepID=UPI0005552406|nr:hypothetical protein [Hymenobacter sp. IS2118]
MSLYFPVRELLLPNKPAVSRQIVEDAALLLAPLIQKIQGRLETLRLEELNRYQRKATPAESALLDEATKLLTRRLLERYASHLQRACQRHEIGPVLTMWGELIG